MRARVLSAVRNRSVAHAVERAEPRAVLVHVADSPGADELADEVARTVVGTAADVPVFLHRQGAASVQLPPTGDVHRVRTLTGAVHEIVAVVG